MKKYINVFNFCILTFFCSVSFAQNVGIGTITPVAKLEIVGDVKIVDGTQGAGKLLTSDATGRASWQPPPIPPGMDIPSVRICCQRWMTKNLDVSTYRNGDVIPKVTNATTWAALTTGAYCYFNNDSTTYAATYGKLYNWYAVNDPRGLAPEGWYIPTDFEWTTLGECVGGFAIAGGLLKEAGTSHWNSPNSGATNRSGFTALPGGIREDDGEFHSNGLNGYWWTSTEFVTGVERFRQLLHNSEYLTDHYNSPKTGYSVRCVRD